MAAQLLEPIHVGEPYVAVGWTTGRDGRKLFCESSLLNADGDPAAVARSTWLRLD